MKTLHEKKMNTEMKNSIVPPTPLFLFSQLFFKDFFFPKKVLKWFFKVLLLQRANLKVTTHFKTC